MRGFLFFLWALMVLLSLLCLYAVYNSVTRADGPEIDQIILSSIVAFVMIMICIRSFQTLYHQRISEKLQHDPNMSGFKIFLCLFGIPAIIVPSVMLFLSARSAGNKYDVAVTLSKEAAWKPDPMLFAAIAAGLVLVLFAFFYPAYVQRLTRHKGSD